MARWVCISRDLVQVYGPRHRDVGFTWHDIGDVAMRARRWQQAAAAFELAYSIRADALGEDDDETIQSKTALGEARAAMITAT